MSSQAPLKRGLADWSPVVLTLLPVVWAIGSLLWVHYRITGGVLP